VSVADEHAADKKLFNALNAWRQSDPVSPKISTPMHDIKEKVLGYVRRVVGEKVKFIQSNNANRAMVRNMVQSACEKPE
jgi:hypothetical protein